MMRYVFAHGLGQTPASWEKTVSCLSVDVSEVRCPDLAELLGDKPCTYGNLYGAFAEYCMEICVEAGEPVHICGLSLGGVLALQFGMENPSKVRSLALIAAQYVMPRKLLAFQNVIFRFMPERAFAGTGFGRNDFIGLTGSMREIDFGQGVGGVGCDALILCGEKDKANKKASVELGELLPRAEMRFIKGAGHEVNVDAPEALGEILGEFYHRHT